MPQIALKNIKNSLYFTGQVIKKASSVGGGLMKTRLILSFVVLAAALTMTYPAIGDNTFKHKGLNYWYRSTGQGPVLIVPTPGWGTSSELYFNSLSELENQFTVVYFDTIGSGRSERPKTLDEYSWQRFAEDLEALRIELQAKKIWILGHSMGGQQALQYALDYPQHIAGLILVGTVANMIDPAYMKDIEARLMAKQKEPWFSQFINDFNSFNSVSSWATDESFREAFLKTLEMYFENHEALASLRSVDFWGTTYSSTAVNAYMKMPPFNVEARLAEVLVPTVILVGENDIVTSPTWSERIHFKLKKSKLATIQKSGHFPWIENAQEFFEDLTAALNSF